MHVDKPKGAENVQSIMYTIILSPHEVLRRFKATDVRRNYFEHANNAVSCTSYATAM